jgi:hypothetical protein
MPVANKKRELAGEDLPRPIKFPNLSVKLHTVANNNALTEADVEKILGWEVVDKAQTKKDDYTLIYEGKYIRCVNNHNNRPFYEEWAKAVCQIILKRQWKMNGETMIIGKTGLVLSAQHRGIGFKLACEMWRKAKGRQEAEQDLENHEKLILDFWPECPVLETIIVYGIDEDQETISTLDNTRPRTFGDVLYTSEIFRNGKTKFSPSARERLTKFLGNAIKFLWERTGLKKNESELTEYLTNPELTEFVNHHKLLADAVHHIYVENSAKKEGDKQGPIANLYGPGTAAGLLYLMAMSKFDPTEYQSESPRDEKHLLKQMNKEDFKKQWGLAEQFWTDLCIAQQQRCPLVRPVIDAFIEERKQNEGREAGFSVKTGLLINAWNVFKNGAQMYYDPDQKKVGLEGNIALEKKEDQFKRMIVATKPCLGGIDVLPDQEQEDEVQTPEQIEETKKKLDEEKDKKEDAKRKARQDKARAEVDAAEAAGPKPLPQKPQVIIKPANNNPTNGKKGGKPPLKGGV